MTTQRVNGDTKVWDVLQRHPGTYDIFRRFGCPDMRTGVFALSAHVMKVRWAARVHHIELDRLLADLNHEIAQEEQQAADNRH